MKKIFLFVVSVIVCVSVNAQIKFGVKGGLNITEMELSSNVFNANNRTGFYIGPTAKFSFPVAGLGLDISALYDQREAKVSTADVDIYEETVKSQTLAIPLNVRYQLFGINAFNMFIYAGPQIAFNLGSNCGDWTMRSSNFSGNLGLGFTISKVQVNANYNIAFGNTGEAEFSDVASKLITSDSKAHAWQIGVAYYF